MFAMVRDTFRYRELIWALALKDLKIRYKRSVLGFLWALLNPLLLMVVLAVVFSSIMVMQVVHYTVFLVCVLFPWTFFSQALSYGADSIVLSADLIKKVGVPKLVFPVAAVVSNLVNLLLSLIPLALIVLAFRHPLYATWLYFPVPLFAFIIFTMGASLFFATANVFYRDVSHILQILLQVLFYASPVIFDIHLIPAKYQLMYRLNPLSYYLNGFRMSIYWGKLPSMESMIACFVLAFVVLILGLALFKKYESEFVFYI